jgi:hypothetical protein
MTKGTGLRNNYVWPDSQVPSLGDTATGYFSLCPTFFRLNNSSATTSFTGCRPMGLDQTHRHWELPRVLLCEGPRPIALQCGAEPARPLWLVFHLSSLALSLAFEGDHR